MDNNKALDEYIDQDKVFSIDGYGYIQVMKNEELTNILKDHIKVDVLEKDNTLQKDDELTLK